MARYGRSRGRRHRSKSGRKVRKYTLGGNRR